MNQTMDWKIVFSILLCFLLFSGCITSQESEKGTLRITSSPSGAEIYLDNQFQGRTPGNISPVEPGNHVLELRYPGFKSWSTGISVTEGTSHYYAALIPVAVSPAEQEKIPVTASPPKITVGTEKEILIVGESMLFSGTGQGSGSVILTIFGPGYYTDGVVLDRPIVNSAGLWSYTWNPGYSIQSGSYILVAEDESHSASDRIEFAVVGGGIVTITSNTFSAARGETIKFSGRCTTGARSVSLVLYGPERFSGGVELGSLSVTADKTWNFKYTLDNTMPTGTYTAYVYDVPKTSSGTTQFTVGFTS